MISRTIGAIRSAGGFRALALFLVLPLFMGAAAAADNTAEIKAVRHWKSEKHLRVVFDLSKSVEFSSGRLANPDRLFFDIRRAKLRKDVPRTIEIDHEAVRTIRVGQFSADTARVVFDLKDPSCEFKIFTLEDPPRLVIDIIAKGEGKTKEQLRTDALPGGDPGAEERFVQRTVVIDAGHGGHDPGAVGPTGLYEKDVVLDVVLKAREIIAREHPLYRVVLTRDRDVFIKLEDRAEIANRHKADLFVSVHANASANRKARGIETYLLNWTNDTEALKVAARENAISLKKMRQVQSELGVILASLERESKRDESVRAAGSIQQSLVSQVTKQYPRVSDHGVKQALFYVLVGAKMPSSLVEISFISNRDEEKLLRQESYRRVLARSIADGIHAYLVSRPPVQTVRTEKALAQPIKYTTSKGSR